jgi:hypothetical protein
MTKKQRVPRKLKKWRKNNSYQQYSIDILRKFAKLYNLNYGSNRRIKKFVQRDIVNLLIPKAPFRRTDMIYCPDPVESITFSSTIDIDLFKNLKNE